MITGIGSMGSRPLGQLQTTGVTAKAAAPATASTTDEASSVSISSTASALAAGGAPIDSDKVAQIKAGIAAGTYKPDPRAIAAKMIATDLPGREG